MSKKYVSSLVCTVEDQIVSVEYFKDLQKAYDELDRQSLEEASRIATGETGMEKVTLIKKNESATIVWHYKRDMVMAEHPDFTDMELETACRPRETVFSVFWGPLQ